MGCTNSREDKSTPALRNQSSELMRQNIELLTVIEYLFLKYNNEPGALKVHEIKQRTEDFYAVVTKLRQYWNTKCKENYEKTRNRAHLLRLSSEQHREKDQLIETRNYLKSVLADFEPGWEMMFSNVTELKNKLESSKELMLELTNMYFDINKTGKSNIKKYMNENGIVLDNETKSLVYGIKKFTVKLYKHSTQRVYFTEDIVHTIRNNEEESEYEDISYSISQK
ncbi:hypothetical protein SteCoe_13686 [Stentor coeruleus]|uniref:Uncharacterized protein n=1 Tax=Stentor coeruleus TaxID=5963 RepID=A0A1R2C7W6_9CILI|nr:hypothetical protein SteCoe_13686 [Stentor coeruleus]